jgi:hypothetical protein
MLANLLYLVFENQYKSPQKSQEIFMVLERIQNLDTEIYESSKHNTY